MVMQSIHWTDGLLKPELENTLIMVEYSINCFSKYSVNGGLHIRIKRWAGGLLVVVAAVDGFTAYSHSSCKNTGGLLTPWHKPYKTFLQQ